MSFVSLIPWFQVNRSFAFFDIGFVCFLCFEFVRENVSIQQWENGDTGRNAMLRDNNFYPQNMFDSGCEIQQLVKQEQ